MGAKRAAASVAEGVGRGRAKAAGRKAAGLLDCGANELHPVSIEAVRAGMPDDAALFYLAELFRVLGDHTRVRILKALTLSELCVCDLAELLSMTHSAVSHQLRALRAARLVRFRREGKNVFYAIDDSHVDGLLRLGLDHVGHD